MLTGQLEGAGVVRVGDLLVCEERQCEIAGIDKFQQHLREADSGAVALALGVGVSAEGFRGKTVAFRSRPAVGLPSLTEHGDVVPDVNVLVRWGPKDGRTTGVGVLSFDGLTVTLHDVEDTPVMSAPGDELTVRARGTGVWIRGPGDMSCFVVGPQPGSAKAPRARSLFERYRAQVVPDPAVVEPGRWWERMMVTPGMSRLLSQIRWRRALLIMFRTRGARVG